MSNISSSFRRYSAILATAIALGVTSGAYAQDGAPRQRPQLNDKTIEALGKLDPLVKAQKWSEVMALIDGALPNAGPTSFDRVQLLDIKARIYLQTDDLVKGADAMEAAFKIADQFGYWEEKTLLDNLYLLAQLVYANASNMKDKAAQQAAVAKAAGYMERWQKSSPYTTPDSAMFLAQIQYAQATANPDKVDTVTLQKAKDTIDAGMKQAIHPKDGFYQIKLAVLQQAGDWAASADLAELVVSLFPEKKDMWQFLVGAYLQLGSEKDIDAATAKAYYIRAINTIEKAQSLGLMKTPKDNDNLVKVYLLAGQFSKGTELLEAGLKSGGIENTLPNWRSLGQFYQQADKPLSAIAAFEEGAKRYPREGELNFLMGEIQRSLGKPAEALAQYKIALQKGNLPKGPRPVLELAAFAATEVDDFDAALGFITEAAKDPDFGKGTQMAAFKKYVEDVVKDRREMAEQKSKNKE